MRNKILLAVLITATFALAVFLGVRGTLSAERPAAEDPTAEAARKTEFEAARTRGNLSFTEAKYWRVAPAAGAPTAKGTP
jgi:hypothetical protein